MKNSSNNIMKYLELYCENPSTITAIIRRLFDMPLSAFYGSNTDVILGMLEEFLENCGLDSDRSDEISFIEMLAIIDGIVTSGIYEHLGEDYCRDACYSSLGRVKSMLLAENSGSITIRRFLALPVKDFLCYLGEEIGLFGKNSVILFETYKLDVMNAVGFEMNDKTTISELLLKLDHFMLMPWLPGMDINEFAERIRKAYKCLYRFLIEYPAKAFNDEFDLDTVKNKFSFMKGE